MDDKTQSPPDMRNGPHGRLAVRRREGKGPGLIWLGGYASDMLGSKAEAIDTHAVEHGLAFTRFDYSGCGESDGDFEEGTISRWADDAAHILEHETEGPQILIGSSMGGWIAGLLAKRFPERLAGLIMIAPAPDFATELTPTQWPPEMWEKLQSEGRIEIPSEYDDFVMIYTKAMFDDGAQNKILDKPLDIPCPVRMLTGMKDDVVPYEHVIRYANHMNTDDVTVTLVKDGDHRLSSPGDIARLLTTIDQFVG